MKILRAREWLVFVAIVASAVTWHVRAADSARVDTTTPAQIGRMCEPSTEEGVRMRPADCNTRAVVRPIRAAPLWV